MNSLLEPPVNYSQIQTWIDHIEWKRPHVSNTEKCIHKFELSGRYGPDVYNCVKCGYKTKYPLEYISYRELT